MLVLVRFSRSADFLPDGSDMQYYSEWALRIARGQWTDHLAFYGLPGYAYLLAGFYYLLGFDPFTVALVQAGLFAGIATLVFGLARQITVANRQGDACEANIAGVMAAVGWMFFVPAQTYTTILMPTIWGVGGFWLCVLVISGGRKLTELQWLGIGLLIGLLATISATAFTLVPLVIAAIALSAGREAREARVLSKLLLPVIACFAGIGLGIAPAWIHNHIVAHDKVALSSHSGINLWIGNNPTATGYPKMPPGIRPTQSGSMHDSIVLAEQAAGRKLSRGEVSQYWAGRAKEFVRAHPAEWVRLLGRKLFNFWNAYSYDDVTSIVRLRALKVTWPGVSFGWVAVFGLAGMATFGWSSLPGRFTTAAIILHMAALLPAFVTERYRLLAVPGLIAFGAAWIIEMQQRLARGEFARMAVPGTAAVVAALFVAQPQTDTSLWSLDYYEAGIRQTETGQLGAAQKSLALALAYEPRSADIYFALGNLSLAKENRDGAKACYRRALELNPVHDGVLNNLGVLAMEEKRWPLAESFFLKSLQTEPEDPKTFYLLARVRLERGDRDGARTALNEALRRRPGQREFLELQTQIETR
ncbi:MAG TPA: tetratricopeptide repeat protein [Chthoniobacteraceae bacterium]|nr:tetratricopeptide repeat protein [Chthoniobacteraceae bacterium]